MEPTRAEHAAFAVVSRVLGVTVEHRDTGTPDRQGEVDGHVLYPDGRRGAIEVTMLVDSNEAEVEARLARDDFIWRFPDLHWCWMCSIAPHTRLDEAKRILPELLRYCETQNILDPAFVLPIHHQHACWFRRSGMSARADPTLKRRAGQVHVMPQGRGGAVGNTEAVTSWVSQVLTEPHCGRKIGKLMRSGLGERHLFLVVDHSGAPFAGFYAMAWGEGLPPGSPALGELTHLWLAPRWSQVVLTYDQDNGWRRHQPYDD